MTGNEMAEEMEEGELEEGELDDVEENNSTTHEKEKKHSKTSKGASERGSSSGIIKNYKIYIENSKIQNFAPKI